MKYLALDLRALGLLRIGIGILLMVDIALRVADLEVFYSNYGVAPLSMLFEYCWNPYYISFHTISGLWQVQLLLFFIAFLAAGFLLIGYRTTFFTLLSWILMVSLHNRNSAILQGGDDLLRMILFWGIFLPWGARYSYDHQRVSDFKLSNVVLNPATIAYVLQICYVYTGSALLKDPEWYKEFTALYYVYSLDQITYPIAHYFYSYPKLLHFMTGLAYCFELLLPILFFIPYKHGLFRLIGLILITAFHCFNAVNLMIGLFPFIGIVVSLGLLPTYFLDGMEKIWLHRTDLWREKVLNIGRIINRIMPWKAPVYTLPNPQKKALYAMVIFLTVYTLDWNISNLNFVKNKLSDNLRGIGYLLRLDQSWGMFAPGVLKDDGWYVLQAKTTKNTYIDLINPSQPITYSKPANILKRYKKDRWRKYFENLMMVDQSYLRGYFCNYQKNKWNERHPDIPIKSLELIYIKEFTLPDYKPPKLEKNLLWTCE